MKRLMFSLFFIFLLTAVTEADYKVYLKNGSIISGIISYQEIGNDLILYLDSGSMNISKKDVKKIEETATSFKYKGTEDEMPMDVKEDVVGTSEGKLIDDKVAQWNKLKAERD